MKKKLKLIDGTSDKFWQIEAVNNSFTVTYGRNRTNGVSQTKTFNSDAQCLKEAEKILAEKIKKGYSEDGESGVVSISTKPKTEKQFDLQAILDEYDTLIKTSNLDGLLPFLKKHANGNREALKKHIKKVNPYWTDYLDLANEKEFQARLSGLSNTYNYRATETQQNIITLSAIALLNQKEISPWIFNFSRFLMSVKGVNNIVIDILDWARPNWFDTFLLTQIKGNTWIHFDYELLLELEKKYIVAYNPELFAITLASFAFPYSWEDKQQNVEYPYEKHCQFLVENLRDVKEVFNYETQLYNQNIFFKKLINAAVIERSFFIENTLLIQTKDWNNALKAVYRTTLSEIDVKNDELLTFQHIIFTYFHATLNTIASYGIELVKKIIDEKGFDTDAFLEWVVPVMMRIDCKGGLKTLITMLEKLAQQQPVFNAKISSLLADVLMIPDLTLQERVSKSILKIGDVNDVDLKEKLTMYASQMLGNVSTVLADFIEKDAIIELFEANTSENYVFSPKKENVLLEENRVVLPKDWNEILFQFGKFISSEEVIDTEILLNAFVTQRHLFPPDYAIQLEPYIKTMSKKHWGGIKRSLEVFLLQKIDNPNAVFIPEQGYYVKDCINLLFEETLKNSSLKIEKNINLPALSFTTHAPYWVEPSTLVKRLLAYIAQNVMIDNCDLAIAISRMPRENVEEALGLCSQLPNDLANIITFCLGKHKNLSLQQTNLLSRFFQKSNPIDINSIWATATRTHYPDDVFPEFEKTDLKAIPNIINPVTIKPSFKECWNEWRNYGTRELERSTYSWMKMEFDLPFTNKVPIHLLYSITFYNPKNEKDWIDNTGYSETLYWQSVMPQNLDSLMICFLKGNFQISTFPNYKDLLFVKLPQLSGFKFSENAIFAFACLLHNEDKKSRAFATEILIQYIDNQQIDVSILGQKIAFLMNNNYAPILRVYECFTTLKDVSPLHNSALNILLESVIENLELKEKLPTNFKKILEIFYDLKAKMKQNVSEKVIFVLKPLEENGTLKSIVKQILALK